MIIWVFPCSTKLPHVASTLQKIFSNYINSEIRAVISNEVLLGRGEVPTSNEVQGRSLTNPQNLELVVWRLFIKTCSVWCQNSFWTSGDAPCGDCQLTMCWTASMPHKTCSRYTVHNVSHNVRPAWNIKISTRCVLVWYPLWVKPCLLWHLKCPLGDDELCLHKKKKKSNNKNSLHSMTWNRTT